jgi:23S rRNA (cytidine2498-2'-O)-methyltransferase
LGQSSLSRIHTETGLGLHDGLSSPVLERCAGPAERVEAKYALPLPNTVVDTGLVNLVLSADDSKLELRGELSHTFAKYSELLLGLFAYETADMPNSPQRLPRLVFARQILPNARELSAPSIRAWTEMLANAVIGVLPDEQPWSLHIFPFREVADTTRMGARAWHTQSHGGGAYSEQSPREVVQGAGINRCRLIGESLQELLRKRRRHLQRQLRTEPGSFVPNESLVQLILTSPEAGYLSVSPAPVPYAERHALSFFPAGRLAPVTDKRPPSRAFTKLVEAEVRLGRRISKGEVCVDLGASPGSWTYVAKERGARVIAVDRSELRADLMAAAEVRFQHADAFKYEPGAPVDWLICDVIASAERSAELLLRWLRHGWCRNFVVTLKLDDSKSGDTLERLKRELPELTTQFWLLRLCANKKEACAFGSRVLCPGG